MRFSSPIVLMLAWTWTAHALVTLQTIRDLTNTTDECRERIVALGKVWHVGGGRREGEVGDGTGGQVVMVSTDRRESESSGTSGGGVDKEETEETVAAAIRLICSSLLFELEKPLLTNTLPAPTSDIDSTQCQTVISEFHSFLAATVRFLHEVHERQMYWQWKADSGVFDGVAWMQSLWASRRGNTQDRSFIEQQMAVYGATGCFGKSKEVLRSDVEIVEYLNDLIDLFY